MNETDLALRYFVRGERHWVAASRLLRGSTIHHEEGRGPVIARDFASERRGLIPSESGPLSR